MNGVKLSPLAMTRNTQINTSINQLLIDKEEKIKQFELLLEDKNTIINKQEQIIKQLEIKCQHGKNWQE